MPSTLMLKTLFLSLKEEAAKGEDGVKGTLGYISKVDLLICFGFFFFSSQLQIAFGFTTL